MLAGMTTAQLTEWLGFFIAEREFASQKAGPHLTGDVETDLRAVFGRPKNG